MAERFLDRSTLPPPAAQSPGRAMVKHQRKGHRAVPEDSATSAGRSRKKTNLHEQAGPGRLEQKRRRHAAAGAGRVSTTDEGIESEKVRISIPLHSNCCCQRITNVVRICLIIYPAFCGRQANL